MVYVGIDAGGTKTSIIVYNELGEILQEFREGFGNISVNREKALQHIKSGIDQVVTSYGLDQITAIAIGIAGLPDGNEKDNLEQWFTSLYQVPIKVVNDYILAYRSIFGDSSGMLVIAGTGSVIYGEANDQSLRIGGWGHLLGDEGSGYDIVIRALRASISQYELSGKIPALMSTILQELELNEIEDIKKYVYHHEKNQVAKLVPKVIEHANTGDEFAVRILMGAAKDISDKILNFIHRIVMPSPVKLCLTGGVLENIDMVINYIMNQLKQHGIEIDLVKSTEPNRAVLFYYQDESMKSKPAQYAVGLMSGTSLDGIDTVLCRISGVDEGTNLEVIDFETFPYTASVERQVRKVVSGDLLHVSELSSLNFELGYEYAQCVTRICQRNDIDSQSLFFIASHGQTIFHEAKNGNSSYRSTLQLGEPSVIAYQTGATVVSNFRAKDMAAAGEGAPLVPYSEYVLYRGEKSTILLNIGGIGNLTLLEQNSTLDQLIGFDTGPGNMMINEAMQYFYQQPYDDRGKIAAKGRLITTLLEELMSHWFIKKSPPKSTGRDEFGRSFTLKLIEKYKKYPSEDIIHTLTFFTAKSVCDHIIELKNDHRVDQLVVSGGGAFNDTLMHMLTKLLQQEQIKVLKQEDLGFSSDAKEAIAFVILANQTIHQQPANVPSVTGAEQKVVLGSITYPS